MNPDEITLERVVKLKKDITSAREQLDLFRRNGLFDLNLKKLLKEKEKELHQIFLEVHSKNAWRPL